MKSGKLVSRQVSHKLRQAGRVFLMLLIVNRVVAIVLLMAAGCLRVSASQNEFAGIASANGPFRLDGAVTAGGATVFSGSLVDTSETAARVRLKSNVSIFVDPATRVRLFRDRAQLERGSMSVASSASFEVNVSSLRVHFDESRYSGKVSIRGPEIQIAMANGSATVRSSQGIIVGHVLPGSALAFTPGADNRTLFTMVTGRLAVERNSLQLVDETSHVRFALQGAGLGRFSGQRVSASGNIVGTGSDNGPPTLAVAQIAMASPAEQLPDSGAAAVAASLNIVIEEGDQAINNIKQRVAREVIVRVEDENHKPVSGASLALLLPRSGASGEFLGGGETFNGLTDESGRVTAKFIPNATPGVMVIQVEAQAGTRKASKIFTERNGLIAAGVAAAAGIAAANLGGGGGSGNAAGSGSSNATGSGSGNAAGSGAANAAGSGAANAAGSGAVNAAGTGAANAAGTGAANAAGNGTASAAGTGTASAAGTANAAGSGTANAAGNGTASAAGTGAANGGASGTTNPDGSGAPTPGGTGTPTRKAKHGFHPSPRTIIVGVAVAAVGAAVGIAVAVSEGSSPQLSP
jgi:hypothetical protein